MQLALLALSMSCQGLIRQECNDPIEAASWHLLMGNVLCSLSLHGRLWLLQHYSHDPVLHLRQVRGLHLH